MVHINHDFSHSFKACQRQHADADLTTPDWPKARTNWPLFLILYLRIELNAKDGARKTVHLIYLVHGIRLFRFRYYMSTL